MPTKKELEAQNAELQAKLEELEAAKAAAEENAGNNAAALARRVAELEASISRQAPTPVQGDYKKATPIPEGLDDGPKIGENGQYEPATYATRRGNIREDS